MKEICAISKKLVEVIYEEEENVMLECGHTSIL